MTIKGLQLQWILVWIISYTTTSYINEKNISLIFKNKLPLWHIVHKTLPCHEMFKTNTQTNEQAFFFTGFEMGPAEIQFSVLSGPVIGCPHLNSLVP